MMYPAMHSYSFRDCFEKDPGFTIRKATPEANLATAREHPPAVVKRQQQEDVALLLPGIRHLTERQYQLFFLFHTAIARHKPEGFARLNDDDVAEASGAVAATLETSARGVIYEHKPQSVTAQRLASELTGLLAEIRSQGAKVDDGEVAIVLRAIHDGGESARRFIESLVDHVRDIMAQGAATGLIRPSRDEEARLRYLTYQTMGATLMKFLVEQPATPDDFMASLSKDREYILPVLEVYTEGLFADRRMLDDYLLYVGDPPGEVAPTSAPPASAAPADATRTA